MINSSPYDGFTHSNPWLMEINNDDAIIGPEDIPLTASYIWSKSGQDREDLVSWVFNYYRENGFVSSDMSDSDLLSDFVKLKKKNPDDIINTYGEINNSSSLCNNVFKHFVWDKYFSAKGEAKSRSVIDVFHNDQIFLDVLKNRMGYCLSCEDGTERPYVFTITDKMILQGVRSTGYGYSVSLFKPLVGKYLYKNYAKKRVFDYSAGWGARCLAAMSLGLEYYGVDPLTASEINGMIGFFGGTGHVIDGCSEDNIYQNIPQVDCIMSSPPYFNLEVYSDDERQSISRFKKYEDWISAYWNGTVTNCLNILQDDGYFIMVAKDSVKKHNISSDMRMVCEKNGLVLEKEMCYKTSTNHLSDKKKTNRISKNDEIVSIFCKK